MSELLLLGEAEKKLVTQLLIELGVPAHLKGYRYVRNAIGLVLAKEGEVRGITKWIYPLVAQQYKTTPARVERGIRHAIEVCWTRGEVRTFQALFGHTVHRERGRPTNAEFIARIADHLRMQPKPRLTVASSR